MLTTQTKDSGWLKPILLAVIIVIVVRTFLFSPYTVKGASMEPTLHDRERIVVSKTSNWIGDVKRSDIVIIKGSSDNYVKRVIGLPGDTLEMRNDQLYVNNKQVQESYLHEYKLIANEKYMKLTEDFGPITVPKEHYFVMGDNRHRSMDSRNGLGYIEEKQIIGISKFVISPIKNMRTTE
ncbi:signal peptidase I [Bacillus sp. FJAT-50079]|uniref:signal peptidase I n=1 Tax=Bacillus sp. FJAT-50079 TaxID=2833577 RepID=UPI001BC94CF6|nr:signal peptidase I [Bacillus sp. FJAT-50079]MBS4206541.1 signal peptidase I [Bacillus sp. FJAT-50079]